MLPSEPDMHSGQQRGKRRCEFQSKSGLRYFFLAFLFSIPTIIPDGGSFLFSFAASAINFLTPGRFTGKNTRGEDL
jgi:hypothetical protein